MVCNRSGVEPAVPMSKAHSPAEGVRGGELELRGAHLVALSRPLTMRATARAASRCCGRRPGFNRLARIRSMAKGRPVTAESERAVREDFRPPPSPRLPSSSTLSWGGHHRHRANLVPLGSPSDPDFAPLRAGARPLWGHKGPGTAAAAASRSRRRINSIMKSVAYNGSGPVVTRGRLGPLEPEDSGRASEIPAVLCRVLAIMVAVGAPTFGFAVLSLPAKERTLGTPLTGEPALALAASRGDRQAFGQLVDLHKRTVYGLCYRILRHPEDARDAAQESFVRAYAALATFDPTQAFAPWVLRIARNHCLDVHRRRGARPVEMALEPPTRRMGVREPADRPPRGPTRLSRSMRGKEP